MLTRGKTLKTPNGDGSYTLRCIGEEDHPCDVCGAESVVTFCVIDNKTHWHGTIHSPAGAFQARCAKHGTKQYQDMEWDTYRINKEETA